MSQPIISKAEAKKRLDADLASAYARYRKRIAKIELIQREMKGGKNALSTRATNGLRYLISELLYGSSGPHRHNNGWYQGDITPDLVARLTAKKILAHPNLGHKTLYEVMAWLHTNGYELQA